MKKLLIITVIIIAINSYVCVYATNELGSPFMFGYPDETFKPDNFITRAEMAQIVYRIKGFDEVVSDNFDSTIFPDYPKNHWAQKAIDWTVYQNWFMGDENHNIRMDGYLTRAEFMTLIFRMGIMHIYSDSWQGKTDFIDLQDDFWASHEIKEVSLRSNLEGYLDGSFKPDNFITRSECAKIFLGYFAHLKTQFKTNNIVFVDLNKSHWAYDYIAKIADNYRTMK